MTKNQIEILGDGAAIVQLTKGQVTVIDASDVPVIAPMRWCALEVKPGKFYAVTHGHSSSGRRTLIFMHRYLLEAESGVDVDHRDRDGLNNRRNNIRLASRSMNMANKGISPLNTSGYRGVQKDHHKWKAVIKINRKRIHIGSFASAEDAARAYDAKAVELFNEFAGLNFPVEELKDAA